MVQNVESCVLQLKDLVQCQLYNISIMHHAIIVVVVAVLIIKLHHSVSIGYLK